MFIITALFFIIIISKRKNVNETNLNIIENILLNIKNTSTLEK